MKTIVRMLALAVSLTLLALPKAQAQTAAQADSSVTIRGIVLDEATGQPINAATVRMKSIAVYTNESGEFTLKTKQPSTMMEVTAPGYDRRYIERRGRDFVRIYLVVAQLSNPMGSKGQVEVVTKELIPEGTAVSTVEDISLYTPMQTIDRILETRLGTIRTINRSGLDDIGSLMYIRGINSLNSESQPLVVVDGVIMESYADYESVHDGYFANYLANLDMQDIQTITVIKDASSLYGTKAANGVILIETGRSKDVVTKILVNAVAGTSLKPGTIPTLDAEQSRQLFSELYKDSPYSADEVSKMPVFNEDPNFLYYNKYHNNTDWSSYIYRNHGFHQNYSARATGGDAVGMYALSVGYVGNKGTLDGTDFSHLTFRFNSDLEIAKNVTTAVDFTISSINAETRNDGMNSTTSPYYLSQVKSPVFHPYQYSKSSEDRSTLTSFYEEADDLGINNPLPVQEESEMGSDMTNFMALLRPNWKLNNSFTLNGLAGYQLDKMYEYYFTPHAGVAPFVNMADGHYEVYENEVKAQNMREIRYTLEARLNYQKQLDGHNIAALLGYRFINKDRSWTRASGYNTPDDEQRFLTTSLIRRKMTGEDLHVKNISWFVNGNWDYMQKYFLNAAVSMDASSRFGTEIEKGALKLFGVNWGFFPSVSGAWQISSEDFMANAELIELLKLRVSTGITGNDDIPDYMSKPYFVSHSYIEKANGLVLGNLGNPGLKWETTVKNNVGLDLALLKNRVSLSADFYRHHTYDLLVLKSLDPIAGFDTYWANDGEMTNTGFELALNTRLVNTRDFRWEATATVSKYKNQVTRLADGAFSTTAYDAEIRTMENQPIGVFYGYKFKGVYASDAVASTAYTKTDGTRDYYYNKFDNGSTAPVKAGNAIFEDINGPTGTPDGIIDEYDKTIIGDPNPDFYGMLSSSLSYKDLTLTAVFNYSLGNDVYNYHRRVMESMSTLNNQSLAVINRWRADGQVTDMPQAVYGDPMGNARFSSRWIEDGSYIRLKTVRLAWDVPYKIPFLNDLTVWASANNLWMYTKYLGRDPETSVSNNPLFQGIDAGLHPQCKSFILGFKLNL